MTETTPYTLDHLSSDDLDLLLASEDPDLLLGGSNPTHSTTPKSSDRTIVLHHLVNNLNALCPDINWSTTHPLVRKYARKLGNPHRYYHNFSHVASSLALLDEHKAYVMDMVIGRAVILFHDVVYVPGAPDNEKKSCEFASQFYHPDQMIQIEAGIMATRHLFPFQRFSGKQGTDLDILADIDLAILGASWTQFVLYREKIRAEYRNASDEVFKEGTLRFLRAFLEQSEGDGIYRTEPFCSSEPRARENITLLIKML